MSHRLEEYAHIEEELVALLKNLLAELPPNAASLEVRRAGRDGVVATLKPANRAAASIVVHAENGLALVDFSFGEYEPTWELPLEGYSLKPSKKELLKEVEEMCRAVMAGHCEHRRGLLSIRGTIHVGNRPYRVTHWLVFRTAPRLRGTREYESYVGPQPNSR